ncbi:MAG: hypothetical protein WC238_03680, partial [Parcubacteria group bacterium]
KGAAGGAWKISLLQAYDRVSNFKNYSYDDLKAIGATGLDVMNKSNVGDMAAPKLTAFSLTPKTFDTTNSDQTVTINFTMSDDISGVCLPANTPGGGGCTGPQTQATIQSVSAPDQYVHFYDIKKVSGDKYVATAVIKKGAAGGAWKISLLQAYDRVSNFKNYSYDDLKAIGATGLDVMNTAK